MSHLFRMVSHMTFVDAQPSDTASPVSINDLQVAAVGGILAEIRRSSARAPVAWDDPLFWNVEDSAALRCQYLAVGNAMNFRFWDLVDGHVVAAAGEIAGETYRGSMYLWRRLRCAIDRGELPLDADGLADLTREQFELAFQDDHGRFPLAPGAHDRLANLNDLGRRLVTDWRGEFRNMVLAAGGSLTEFARLSARFRAFDDPVQKLTMVNAIMLCGSRLASFDEEPLPAIDYHLVKQAVRQGLVTPHGSLNEKLTNGVMLDPDESLALRSATLKALVAVATEAGMSTALLDNMYWLNRRICSEDSPACETGGSCPFGSVCAKRTGYGLPLELTRYY